MIRGLVAGLCLLVAGLLCLDRPARSWWQSVPQISVVASGTSYTWNPATLGSTAPNGTITLSNGNKTATGTGNSDYVLDVSTLAATGKFYLEIVGTTTSAANWYFQLNDLGPNSAGIRGTAAAGGFAGGTFTYNGANQTGYNIGSDVVGITIDAGAGKMWQGTNNTYDKPTDGPNPVFSWTPQSGIYLLFTQGVSGGSQTLNAKASDQTYSPPAGYTALGGP